MANPATRAALLATLVVALAATAAPAQAGSPIAKLPACANSYLYFAAGVSRTDWRAALLCLVNGARKAQGLPALRRAAPLETVAQSQSEKFARTGSASHGRSLTDITKRFARRGYRAAAYNEGFAVLGEGASPYAFLEAMLARSGVPCNQILDPRFRDVGIGVAHSASGRVDTLALEFGLRAGARQPSTKTGPAASCGHRIPKPLVTGTAVEGSGSPVAAGDTVTVELTCRARAACTFAATLSLATTKAAAPAQTVTIAAGATEAIAFAFGAGAVAAELAAVQPRVSLAIAVSAPAQYADTLSAPLAAG